MIFASLRFFNLRFLILIARGARAAATEPVGSVIYKLTRSVDRRGGACRPARHHRPLSRMLAIGAFSRRQTTTTLSSIAPRRRRTSSSTEFSCSARTPISRRSNHALLQTFVDGGARVPKPRKACSPRARFSTSSTRPFAQVSCKLSRLSCRRRSWGPHRNAGPCEFLADHRGSRLVDPDGVLTGRQTLSAARTATSRRRPRPARRRRLPATNRAATRRRLIPPYSANPPNVVPSRFSCRVFYCPVNALHIQPTRSVRCAAIADRQQSANCGHAVYLTLLHG